MPYFTAALCGSMSSAVYSSSGTHTAVPQCKRLYTYRIVVRPIVVSTAPSGLADGDAVLHSLVH